MNSSSTQNNNTDPEGSLSGFVHSKALIPGMIALSILLTGIVTFNASASTPTVETGPIREAINSQRMVLLTPTFTVEPKQAIGGPDDIVIINNALESQLGLLNDAEQVGAETIVKNGLSYYIVREGDTLSEIAELFDVSINTIRWENNIGNTIKLGQELRILPVTGVRHKVVKGDTFGKIAQKYDSDVDTIIIYNGLIKETELKIGGYVVVPNGIIKQVKPKTTSKTTSSSNSGSKAPSGYYIRPTAGAVTSSFGPRWGRFHYGMDYGGNVGAPIVAAASGTVAKTSCGSGYGKCLVIKHANGTDTLYAHANRIFVSTGQSIKQGQKIAEVGKTGNVTGPHLHFEIIQRSSGRKLNPKDVR